jgi:hypothetical protein
MTGLATGFCYRDLSAPMMRKDQGNEMSSIRIRVSWVLINWRLSQQLKLALVPRLVRR